MQDYEKPPHGLLRDLGCLPVLIAVYRIGFLGPYPCPRPFSAYCLFLCRRVVSCHVILTYDTDHSVQKNTHSNTAYSFCPYLAVLKSSRIDK